MEYKEIYIPLKYKIIAGLVAFIMLSSILGSLWQNKGLKDNIRERDNKIEKIDETQEPIFEEILADAEEIKKRDAVILALSNKQKALQKTIKQLKNEINYIKDNYASRSIDERIRVFSRLATEKDSTQ